jgi:hypothetical protein
MISAETLTSTRADLGILELHEFQLPRHRIPPKLAPDLALTLSIFRILPRLVLALGSTTSKLRVLPRQPLGLVRPLSIFGILVHLAHAPPVLGIPPHLAAVLGSTTTKLRIPPNLAGDLGLTTTALRILMRPADSLVHPLPVLGILVQLVHAPPILWITPRRALALTLTSSKRRVAPRLAIGLAHAPTIFWPLPILAADLGMASSIFGVLPPFARTLAQTPPIFGILRSSARALAHASPLFGAQRFLALDRRRPAVERHRLALGRSSVEHSLVVLNFTHDYSLSLGTVAHRPFAGQVMPSCLCCDGRPRRRAIDRQSMLAVL